MLKCYLFTALPSLLPRPGFARAFMWSEATVAQSSESCVSISFFDRATLLTLPRYGRFALRSASLIAGLRPEAPSLHSTGALPQTPLQRSWRSPSFATSPFGACGNHFPEPCRGRKGLLRRLCLSWSTSWTRLLYGLLRSPMEQAPCVRSGTTCLVPRQVVPSLTALPD